ncbi:MAG: hypothetical protein SFX18_12720 [Pirellulales bacterium]|nr:hypothetical protein [Pirellulales bacterium]
MLCQHCGVEASTKYVAFYQNIGALIMRFTKSIEGNLCKSCIHKQYWSLTGTTAILGWWGMISLVVTPFLLLNNTVRYLFCLTMEPVGPGALAPTLTDAAVQKILPHTEELFNRMGNKEELPQVLTAIAQRAGVTPGQVLLFVRAVIEEQEKGS